MIDIDDLLSAHWCKADRMAEHPNKHIREAIRFAEQHGWRFEKANARAHISGTVYCAEASRTGCKFRVYSTPRDPVEHARKLKREVENCSHS